MRDPGRASLGRTAQAARLAQPRPLDQGRASLGLFLLLRLFFFFLLALISFSAGAVLLYMGFKSSLKSSL